MNKTRTTLLMLATATFIMSCGNNNPNDSPTGENTRGHEEIYLNQDSQELLELNDGEKWVVNEEMKPYVETGRTLVAGYNGEGQTDYQDLANKLKEQNDRLIQSCTMTGKGHDELHKWLHPHLELVYQLSNTTETHQAQDLVDRLQESYRTYHEYFD